MVWFMRVNKKDTVILKNQDKKPILVWLREEEVFTFGLAQQDLRWVNELQIPIRLLFFRIQIATKQSHSHNY